jgi:hypothetical protein
VDRLDECLEALMSAQPALTPLTPAEEEVQDKRELVAEKVVDEEQWPPPDSSVHANTGASTCLD